MKRPRQPTRCAAGAVSYPDFVEWRDGAVDIAKITAGRSVTARVTTTAGTKRVSTALVASNDFAVLELGPSAATS